jgi:hypothetical protein
VELRVLVNRLDYLEKELILMNKYNEKEAPAFFFSSRAGNV